MSRLPRLLLAALLGCALPVLLETPAGAACTCDDATVQQAAQRADVVFRGTLVQQSVAGRSRSYSLEVTRIYRGRVAETPVVVESARSPADCGLGELQVDRSYVVFARDRDTTLRSSRCDGTGRATPAYLRQVEQVLGEGNPLPRPTNPPEERSAVEYTRVGDGERPDLTRLAAPGAALVLVGLLGLLLARRRG